MRGDYERNEVHFAERDEQRWQDWKPHQPNIFPLTTHADREANR